MARFSLIQMLAFVFACCVYLAALRGFIMWPTIMWQSVFVKWPTVTWHSAVVQFGAWLALLVLYDNWQLPSSMVVHLVPFVTMFFMLLVFNGEISAPIVVGCTFGTLISFPLAITTFSARRFKAGSRVD